MTISSATRKAGPFLGNSVTTSFPFTFKVFQASDLQVIKTSAAGVDLPPLILNSDYSVALNSDQNANPGGSITYPLSGVILATGEKLTATGVLSALQSTHITNGGNFFANNIEDQMDYLTILIQQIVEELSRVALASSSDVGPVLSIGTAVQRALKFIAFDASGNIALSQSLPSGTLSLASILSFLKPQTPAEVTAGVVPTNLIYDELNLLRYGADPTGATASDTAMANALKVACPIFGTALNARYVYCPSGQYLFNSTINCTNTRVAATLQTDSLRIYGDSAGGTIFIGKTGAGHAIIETTGAQWLALENITLQDPGTSGRSTVGIFQGVSSLLPQTQNQKFRNVNILMNDNAGANGGAGSVAIWNFGAEENTYDAVYVQANLPLMFTAHNPDTSTGFTTPTSYQTLSASHSLGVSTFSGECFVVTVQKRQPSIITTDVNSIKFENVYMANTPPGSVGTNQSAWKVYGALNGVDFNGTIENHGRFMEVTGIAQGVRGRVTFGSIDSGSTEHFLLNRGGQGQLDQCDINILDNVSNTRPLFAATPSGTNEQISCFIRNCSFKINCDKQYLTIQENVLWNPSTGDVTIEGYHNSNQPYRYTIDANRVQEVAIPETACLINAGITSAEVVRFILPTVTGGQNALAADIRVEGIARINGSGTGSMSTKFVAAHVSVALTNTGTITTTTDAFETGTAANANAGGNNITAMAISATSGGGGTFIQIIWTPTRTGANNETVNFVGTARLRWAGNESRAPSLQTLS